MSIINTSSFRSDLLPLVKKWFGDAYKDLPNLYEKMLKVEAADARAYQVDALVSTMAPLQQKDEGSPLTIDSSRQGITPRYVHSSYALGFIITMEMMEDGDAFKNAKRFTEMLKRSAVLTKELLAANVFNNAFTSTATMSGGDGQCLVSTSHPTRAGTASNLITGGSVDISEAALEQITIDIKNLTDDRGNRIMVRPKNLICSVNDEPTATRILKSNLRVATADNDLNYLKQTGAIQDIIANPYLTDSDAFFVTTDIQDTGDGVKMLMRKDATVDEGNDFETKNNKFSVVMRLSTGWSDYRAVVGSAGA